MKIYQGLDGAYVISNGKLLKVVHVEYSENYFSTTGGYAIYTLEDGSKIKIG